MAGRRAGRTERGEPTDRAGRTERGEPTDRAGRTERGEPTDRGGRTSRDGGGLVGNRRGGDRDGARDRNRGWNRERDRDGNRKRDGGRDRGRDGGEDAAPSRGTGADADPEAIARQICLRLLTVAPRTRAQLAAALRRRGVPEDAATSVLARFAEVKLIDDQMFARAWVESRHHGRGLAGRTLGAELRQRGVASDDIQVALSLLGPDQELATARELVARRLASTAGMEPAARMRRLAGLLARKGYSPGLAYRVVREALEREAKGSSVPFFDLDDVYEPADDEEATEM